MADHILQHGMHDEGIAFVDGAGGGRRGLGGLICWRGGRLGGGLRRADRAFSQRQPPPRRPLASPAHLRVLRLEHGMAVEVQHPLHNVRPHPVASVGEHRIGCGHLHGRHGHGAAADGQLGVARKGGSVEPEAAGMGQGGPGAHFPKHPHGDQIDGAVQRLPQPSGAAEAIVVVAGPVLNLLIFIVEHKGRIYEDGGRRHAPVQSRRIDEGLEAGTRLAGGLQGVIELIEAEVEAAFQGQHGPGVRVQRDQRPLDFR